MPTAELTTRRRDEIARAASSEFAEHGYHATGIADIALRLGIGHGTFYRYFQNKRDILEHVLEGVVERIGAALSSEDPESASTLTEYRAQSERIGRALCDVFIDDSELAQLFFVEGMGADQQLAERLLAAQDLFAEVGERYLRNGVERGFLRADLDIATSARAINGMIFAGALAAARMPDAAAARERWVASLTSLMFEGVSRRRPPTMGESR
ncbi:MAG: TetR/AcrR family transcriptional regulator [Solirubrobacterales bacterium]|nr:TetR/AcrR family transcriptional regulator [Solirubrobacterales bacterium]